MIWSIAWKNMWRNKRRSLVVIGAVIVGIISVVLVIGIMKGWSEQRLQDVINNEVSHIQIHNNRFLRNEEMDCTVIKLGRITQVVDSLPEVSGWVKRTKIMAMINTPWANTGVKVYGIEAGKEKQITEIYKKIVPEAGEYLSEKNAEEILISDKTAELLKLKHYIVDEVVISKLKEKNIPENSIEQLNSLRDIRYRSPKEFSEALQKKLTDKDLKRYENLIKAEALVYRVKNKVQITFSDINGNPVQGVFRVCGIYKTNNTGFDQTSVFVHAKDLSVLYGGSTILVHEISLKLKDENNLGKVKQSLTELLPGNTIDSWKELAPDAALMSDYMLVYYVIIIGIILLALAFGIINTMLMAILERTRELGMLMAIGMNRKRIFRMIMYETLFLTFVGAVTGMILGWLLIEILGKTGIHFSGWGEGYEAIGFASKVYPMVTFDFYVITTLMVTATAVISSIWPARKALKLNPIESLRKD